jgi:hypothetical protein
MLTMTQFFFFKAVTNQKIIEEYYYTSGAMWKFFLVGYLMTQYQDYIELMIW